LLDENNFVSQQLPSIHQAHKARKRRMRLLVLGNSAAEIASQLFISVSTTETHRRKIKQKLDASNMFELSHYRRAFDLI
jgi:DNA-binding CsgD family transcriptional regulator